MIRIFQPTDTIFASNGDVVLQPLKAKVHKKDNGDFYLDIETSLAYVDFFVEGNIIVANTPQGDQAFRISNVEKTKSKISCKCWHVFYDSENYLIADSYVVDKNCNDALIHLNNATEPQSEFTVFSDVSHVDSYRCVRKSLYEAIETVLERWGGHLVRDNFTISIRESIGQDNGITVQYKKNLKDITCQEDWSEVVTKLLPVGKDGILLNALDPSASIYVTSEVQYSIPYTKTVSFNQDIDEEDYETTEAYQQALVSDLYAQASAYVEENSLPKVNYTLKANLEKVTDIGDTIEVIDDRLSVNMLTHVIGFEYDCISERYTEIEFGNFTQSLSGFANSVTAGIQKTYEETQATKDSIITILEKSYVVYDGTQILVLDALPKEEAQNVIIIDSQGIGFSQSGINGTPTSKWAIDGSMQLKDALTIGDHQISDFIIEDGVLSDWEYRIYDDGSVECWRQISVSSSSITWSSLITGLTQGTYDVDYPFDIDNAQVTACLDSASVTAWIAMAKAHDSNTTRLTIVRSGSTGTIKINLVVRGTMPTQVP